MIKAGTKNIKKIFLGSTEIKKVYYGAQLIWNSLFFRFKDRVLADGGTLENEFIPDDKLNPSLLMLPSAYKAGKLYSVLPEDGSGDFTVERNSTATRVNKDGLIEIVPANTPRIDYSTGEPMLLVEGQSTNLVTDSEEISMWAFTSGISVIDDYDFAPDGKKTASKIIFSSSSQQKAIPITASTGEHNASLWVKGVANEKIQIRLLSNISLYTLTGQWQKIELTGLTTSDARISIGTYIGATAREVLIWGVQATTGEPTSYIPTNGSIVTRLADNIHNILPASGNVVITFADGTTQIISGNAGDAFTLPEGLIAKVEML